MDLGLVDHSVIWFGRNILIQFKVEVVIVSILLEENANIGIMDELIPVIRDILKPFCTNFNPQSVN
jgi:hypothetical protein